MTDQTLATHLVDGLLAAWRADATLAGYGDRLRIFDGPPVTDRAAPIEIWAGSTGDPDDEETVIRGSQQWETMRAPGDRGETLEVSCAIWVADGSVDIATARRTAIDVFHAAAGAIRGSDLGADALYDSTEVISWELRQAQYPTGVGAVLVFIVRGEGVV